MFGDLNEIDFHLNYKNFFLKYVYMKKSLSPVRRNLKNRKRNFRRKRGRFGKRMRRVNMGIQRQLVTSDCQFVKLRYMDVDTPTLGSTIAAYASNTYKINSAYDVNGAIATSNMPGFLEWAGLYNRYRVHACKIRTEFMANLQAVAPTEVVPSIIQSNFFVGVYFPSYNGNPPASWGEYLQLKSLPYSSQRCLSTAGGMDRQVCKVFCPIWKLFGNKRQVLGDDNFDAPVTGNPAFVLNGLVYALTPTGTVMTNLSSVIHRTEVTMYIEFYQRKNVFS